jgi:ferredoxin-NADP reductase
MSMLRSMAARGDRRPVWLFYGNKSWDDVAYREELEALRGGST